MNVFTREPNVEGHMRKYFLGAISLALILAHSSPGLAQVMLHRGKMPQYVSGEILVKFKKTAPKGDIVQLNTSLGAKTIKEFPSIGVRHIKLKPGETVPEAIKKYSSDPTVEYAEPNYKLYASQTFPNDPSFGELWGLHNIGQVVNAPQPTAGIPDADINAPEAWDITTGSATIVIAVTDTGVYYIHGDLAANMWKNPGEIPGNGIDDDWNGFVDDYDGWDFFDDDNNPTDQNDHGTHVAGTIAAVGNNAIGVAGVMWTASIMPLRFLGPEGGTTADAIDAINYASMMGAHIINASWGGYGYSQALYDAIKSSGVLFVAAAGNEANDNDGAFKAYPASYNLGNIISVAATDQDDLLADFSNYGVTSVDVGAPGTNIYSSIVARSPLFSDDMEIEATTRANWQHDGVPDTWDWTDQYGSSGTHSWTDSPWSGAADVLYVEDTNSWLGLFSGVDLVGQVGTKLTFWARHDLGPT